MNEDSDLNVSQYPSDEMATVEETVAKKHPTRSSRLAGIAVLALLLIVAVIMLTPGLRKDFVSQPLKALTARRPTAPADPGPLPAVPVLWKNLDLEAMPAEVAQDLRSGKYYYDKRLPGNFGLAIDYWKKALARPEGADRVGVQNLVVSAERELARQFSTDSGDAVVLLKQGKRDQAVILLEKMRADYLDISARQYVWASVMLARRRR
jgi:hypothetical protein